jgi:hypothetical protein
MISINEHKQAEPGVMDAFRDGDEVALQYF